jgi:putative ABC transport system ATP-binding protein
MYPNGRSLVSLQKVSKVYQTRQGTFEALKSIDFQVGTGEFVAIVGPSGSGKSTLINMLTAIDRPTTGEVYVAGERLTGISEDQAAYWRGKKVGVVFQFFQLLPTLTALENVVMPMTYTGTYRGVRKKRALELLDWVGVGDVAHSYPNKLSGGQLQRVAIARALANEPQLLVGDEPTGNLDPVSANHILGLFKTMVDQGTTIVMVTHDKDLAE